MKIGELAKRVDCAVETIRYWEKEGLLPAPHRSEGNYRMYNEFHLERLLFIRNCRTLDMSLEEIRLLLNLRDQPRASCNNVNELIDEHIHHVVKRIEALKALEVQLRALRQRCTAEKQVEQCGILEGLATTTLPSAEADAETHLLGLRGH